MSKRYHLLILFMLILPLSACNLTKPAASMLTPLIPTVAALPTITDTAVPAPTLPPTWTPTFTHTPTVTPSPTMTSTVTPTMTATEPDTATPTATVTVTPSLVPTATFAPPPMMPPGAGVGMPTGVSPQEARLWQTPILPTLSWRVRQIYAEGRAMGRRGDVFAKVGDCHSASEFFMVPFGVNEFDLGPYSYLQGTIDRFMVAPREGVLNSFVLSSIAASNAFNAAAVMDPTWSPADLCVAGEKPIDCEYRIINPSVSLIMLGSVDMQIYDAETFRTFLGEVVTRTLDAGIIPVLTTFASSPDFYWPESLAFNNVILDIAEREQIPVINLWRASRSLPHLGLADDNFHLSHHPDGGRFARFTGEELLYGATLHNLLSLQTLDLLGVNVLW